MILFEYILKNLKYPQERLKIPPGVNYFLKTTDLTQMIFSQVSTTAEKSRVECPCPGNGFNKPNASGT